MQRTARSRRVHPPRQIGGPEGGRANSPALRSAIERDGRAVRPIKPVELNNVLIQAGLECSAASLAISSAEDFARRSRGLTPTSHAGAARMAWKETRNEHNCVVVTAVGQAFEDGNRAGDAAQCGNLRLAPVRLTITRGSPGRRWRGRPNRSRRHRRERSFATQPSTTMPAR